MIPTVVSLCKGGAIRHGVRRQKQFTMTTAGVFYGKGSDMALKIQVYSDYV